MIKLSGVSARTAWFGALMLCPLAAAAQGYDCLVAPSQVVEVRAPTDGLIASVTVTRGDPVRRGQTLVTLESEAEKLGVELARQRAQMEGQVASARTRIDYAGKKLARLKDLADGNFSSALARDEADAELRLAQAELQSALEARAMAQVEWRRSEKLLALRTLSAPFDGVVVDRMLNPGDLAESGAGRSAVLKVARIDPMHVDVALPAALWDQVQSGRNATVTPVVGGQTFQARVHSVDRVIDAASGTFIARLAVPNPKGQVPGGARCQARIDGVPEPVRPGRTRPSPG